MKKKNADDMTFKEKIMILKRCAKFINSADRGRILRDILSLLPDIISTFSGIFLASLVIDGVLNAKPVEELIFSAVIICGINLIVSLMRHMINAKYNRHSFLYNENTKRKITEKILSIDYVKAEEPEILNSAQAANNYLKGSNVSILGVYENIEGALRGVITVITGIILIAPAVFSKSESTDGFMGLICSPWGALAVFLIIIPIILFRSKFVDSEAAKIVGKVFGDKELLQADRTQGYFRNYALNNYRSGKEVRIYDESSLVLGKYNESAKIYHRKWTKCCWKIILKNGENILTTFLINILLYGFTVARAVSGAMTVGEIVGFVMYFNQINRGITNISDHFSQMLVATPFCKKVFDFLEIPDEKYKGTLPTEKRDDNEYEFAFSHVYFKYPGTENYVLKDINLKWKIGEKMALVGQNGCGKSTLVKLLCRLYDPTEGIITLNGIDIKKYKYEDYMALFSVVFQDSKIFSFSMAENVAADTEYDSEQVTDCVIRAGLDERLKTMEHGIETMMYKDFDETGVEISGGEMQKLCLARAVYKGAPFIVLDEPTAALDPVSEYDIYTKFNGIVGTRTAIYISHRLSSCRFCDEITVMNNGEIVERGSHETLLARDGYYTNLWNAQAKYYQTMIPEKYSL